MTRFRSQIRFRSQTRFGRQLRQTLTIARRDFIATVFTPIFLLFLFAPLIMSSFGAIGGLGAANAADGSSDRQRMVLVMPVAEARLVRVADEQLRATFPRDVRPPAIVVVADPVDPRGQLSRRDFDVSAVMRGPLDHPAIFYAAGNRRDARYLAAVADVALRRHATGDVRLSTPTVEQVSVSTPSLGGQKTAAFFAVFGIFFLTLFLSGQVVGTMAEERNNKVIEVLAAAVPLESVFLGKLLGMFGVAVLFVAFWGTIIAQVGRFLPADWASQAAQLVPAVGTGWFALLFVAYFTTAYLLLGAVFLGVGAQASTMREIQMLSLPITVVQVGMFALSSAAASRPGSWVATLAELFPLSSPFAMAGHAANRPELWPHLAALAWQILWVSIFITVGARLFRRGVLQSASSKPAWKRLFTRG